MINSKKETTVRAAVSEENHVVFNACDLPEIDMVATKKTVERSLSDYQSYKSNQES
ncbi:hypothetical protein [Paenibacillus wynnii]|uniref:hypothetical protein n=1 Tax=Paenibacillus wynnii TaxID=268407 RepID=UPI0012FBB9D3|nr:hypothetical protein [Paenibacillus wynnii]